MKLKDIKETEFPLKPQGLYECVVNHVEKREGPNGPYFNWQYEIVRGPHASGKLFDVTSLSPKALWKLKKVLTAILGDGPTLEELLGMDTDSEDFARQIQVCIEKRCKAYIEHRTTTYQGKTKVVEDIKEIYPLESGETSIDVDKDSELPF